MKNKQMIDDYVNLNLYNKYSSESTFIRDIIPVLQVAKTWFNFVNDKSYFKIVVGIDQGGGEIRYGVICWNGKEYNDLPFNISMNSASASLRAFFERVDGGHYDEREQYHNFLKNCKIIKEFYANDIEY